MKWLISSVLFFLVSFSLSAYEIKGELINKDTSVSIIEGQTFNAYLRIWPFANADLAAVKEALNEKDFLDFFYIVNVQKVEYSNNNEEVLEIEAKVILKKFYVPRTFYIWPYKSLTIPFDIINIQPVKNPTKQDFLILQQPVIETIKKNPLSLWVYFIVVLVIGMLSYFLILLVRRNRIKKVKQAELDKWIVIFKNVRDRESLEEIYRTKDNWLPLVGGETPPILMFFKLLNKIQFKKDWDEMEEHQVNEAFDEMRSIFERN
ncbi:hypothetical protein A9Q84_21325 [Halobacteriovorax marinus]|uniref:Uncharacterized protein n=1 Tax=Halobacteriovorax marinus TaxID=97084 RepID=A0A1Y5F1L8_9BACT|nr:hypothetical protein A9Q84_21325 [Halobacteriovorax marinus]